MPVPRCVDVVVGLQYGSESKGKLIEHISANYKALCRSGAINAAHTTYYNNKPYAWHTIPCGALHAPQAKLILGAGAQISPDHLEREIKWLQENNCFYDDTGKPRLYIDGHASVIDEYDVYAENGFADLCGPQWFNPTSCQAHNGTSGAQGAVKQANTCEGCELYPKDSAHKAIGSTTHGCGMNLIRKIARGTAMIRDNKGNKIPPPTLAADHPLLKPFVCDTVELLHSMIDAGDQILVEGTQGSGLSLHFGTYPYVTSRETNASNWICEMGIPPSATNQVFGVCRTFPIRVAGNSGPTGGLEVSWEYVTKHAYGLSGSDEALALWLKNNDKKMIAEKTTATKRYRRVHTFSITDFQRAIKLNRPDTLMLSFIDYLNMEDYGKTHWEALSHRSRGWVEGLEDDTGCFFKYLSTGPQSASWIIR